MAVGIALVGTGFALSVQLPVFRLLPDAEVRTLVGRDPARTAGLAAKHHIPHSTVRLAEALADPGLDLVCISTPPDSHAALACEALAAGKHVLCEKPMALDVSEARAMELAAARTPARLALIDHQLRFAPAVLKMRRLLREGYLGTPFDAHIEVATPRWLDHARRYTWWQERARGGGALGAFGSHAVDLLRWLFGDVDAVQALLHTFVTDRAAAGELQARPVDADDWAAVWLRFAGPRPVLGTIRLSAVAHRGQGFAMAVQGSEGTLRLDSEGRLWGSRRDTAAAEAPLEELDDPEALPEEHRRALPDSPWARAFVTAAQALVAAVPAGNCPSEAATFADGRAVQQVLDAARASAAANGGWMAPGAF